jgi:predicted P-loop ATPase
MVEHALHLASLGWHVFPVPPGTKKGYGELAKVHSGTNWGSTTDPDKVRANFTSRPEANIGVATGAVSGIFDVETDTAAGHGEGVDGAAELAKLEAKHGKLPDTLQFMTPSGSKHSLFVHYGPGFKIKNLVGLVRGVDVKGDGGFFQAPPSMVPAREATADKPAKPGGTYKWLNDLPIADAPQWLLDAIQTHNQKPPERVAIRKPYAGETSSHAGKAMNLQYDEVASAPEGTRNDALNKASYRLGQYIGAGELSDEQATETMLAACESNGSLEDDGKGQCLATIKSGIRGGIEDPVKTSAEMFKGAAVAKVAAAGAAMVGQTPAIIAELAAPTVDEFLACTTDVPAPSGAHPFLSSRHYPDAFTKSLNQAVGVVAAMIEPCNRKTWRSGRVLKLLAVVKEVDKMTFNALVDRIKMAGLTLPAAHLAQACYDFGTEISNVIFGAARTAFICGSNGRPDSGNSDNVAIFLNLSARKARFDSFTRSIEIAKGDAPFKKMDQSLLDDAFVEARSSAFDFQAKQDFFRTSVKSIARRETYDSLQTHVAALPKWDGERRLDRWLARVCGVDEDQYHAIAGRTIIGGMIARARRPGCYFRHVLLLIGTGQNEGKTYLCRILAGDDWVCVGFRLSGSEQNMRPKLAGKWVVELGEMAGLTRDNIEDVKTFLSEPDDEFVAKYEAETTRHPRRCVFIGTSNNEEPLLDDNNHRFLPVYIRGGIDIQWLKDNRDQLLAEAAHLDEQPGHSWDIPKGEADKLIREKQEEARFKGAIEDQIANWFGNVDVGTYITGNNLQAAFRMAGHGANVRPKKFMEKHGFRRGHVGTKRERAWVKGGAAQAKQLIPAQTGGPNTAVTFREIVSPQPRYEFDWNGLTVAGEGPFTPEDVIELRNRFPSLRPAAPYQRQGVWQQIERPDLPMGWRVSQRLN